MMIPVDRIRMGTRRAVQLGRPPRAVASAVGLAADARDQEGVNHDGDVEEPARQARTRTWSPDPPPAGLAAAAAALLLIGLWAALPLAVRVRQES
jgi:hypothetical protein